MASSVIHIIVANEINKTLKRNNKLILMGSIAPDISKHIGKTKIESHFLDNINSDIPNTLKFQNKYNNHMNNDFVLGYYIHLYTDYLWFKYFITEIYNEKNNELLKIDGNTIKCNKIELDKYIYNDYSNLDIALINKYNIDLNIFNDIPNINNIIEEIPTNTVNIIIDKVLYIINNSKVNEELIFNIDNIKKFINISTILILSKINELNL